MDVPEVRLQLLPAWRHFPVLSNACGHKQNIRGVDSENGLNKRAEEVTSYLFSDNEGSVPSARLVSLQDGLYDSVIAIARSTVASC